MRNCASITIESAGQTCLIFGDPKTGKSWLYGLLASHYNLHVIDLEGSTKTFLQSSFPMKLREKISIYRVPDTTTVPTAIDTVMCAMETWQDKFSGWICETHGKWNCSDCKMLQIRLSKNVCAPHNVLSCEHCTPDLGVLNLSALDPAKDIVVIDSATQLSKSAIAFAMLTPSKDEGIAKPVKDGGNATKRHWGQQGALLDHVFSDIQAQTNCNIIVTTHEAVTEMEDGSTKLAPICGTANYSKQFAKFFDNVIHCDVINGKYVASSNNDKNKRILVGTRLTIDVSEYPDNPLLPLFQTAPTKSTSTVTETVVRKPVNERMQALMNKPKS